MKAKTPKVVSWRFVERQLGMPRRDLQRLGRNTVRYYVSWDRKAPRKNWRHIDEPTELLKTIQRRILDRLLNAYPLPPTMTSSIRDHASRHTGHRPDLC